MTVTNYRRIERRRSARVTLAVPLRVDGQDLSGETFIRRTHSHTVSQFGCMIPLEEEIVPGEVLVLMNEHTRQSAQARVVTTRRGTPPSPASPPPAVIAMASAILVSSSRPQTPSISGRWLSASPARGP